MASAQIPQPPPPESQTQGEGDPNPPTQQSFVNISSSNLSIGFINCVGQSKFNLRKQLEIQNYVKSQHLDIVHLQEVKIDSDCFSECPFIRSNFNIFSNNTKNDTYYGTASLVRSDLEVTNLHVDQNGRVIIFDTAGCTWANIYLPSGSDGASRAQREQYSAEVLPQLLLNRLPNGAAGGDLNSIISLADSNRNANTKISPSFKSLVSSFAWLDSYRVLFPKTIQYSRVYSNTTQGEGASRIDRCYHWGDLCVQEAEYHPISFSDHLSLRLVYKVPSRLSHMVAPQARPHFKIPPEIVNDEVFAESITKAVAGWLQVKEAGVNLISWWQLMVKPGIRNLAKARTTELKKQRRSALNLLCVRQAYLGGKVRGGDFSSLGQLAEVNLRICKWYEEESQKIILLSRSEDINTNEKVRIYHHALHRKHINRSSILKLETPTGIVEGQDNCARALEENVAAHLLHAAPLDLGAQEILLSEVDQCFTEEDNLMLLAVPTKDEVKEVLSTCRSHAAPGTDGITAYFYKKFWHILGDSLTEVIVEIFNGAPPPACMRTSLMVFGNKPGKKAKSLKISDRRKLSLLNVDFKIATGVEAKRLRQTMSHTISPQQLVTGGDRRISHGVALARDAINAAASLKRGCGILDTDLVAAFCNMVLTWCLKVMEKKGMSLEVIKRFKNLYMKNYSIIVVNNIPGRCIENVRLTVRQGDKCAMEIFTFGMDPVLCYLEKRLEGILIHSLPVQGPILNTLLPPAQTHTSPPTVGGLQPLPDRPPPPHRRQLACTPSQLPPIETRYKLIAFCDDLKPAITNIYEFHLVERIMTIFELSSGCKMHRTPGSAKCKFLPLGKWRNSLTQAMVPFDFFTLSDHLDFLGVTLMATYSSTRRANGDILKERVRNTIGPWKGGRFMPLNLRAHSVNCFAYSKLYYRCNVIDPRVEDVKYFTSQAKSFIYADMLEKPQEEALYRGVEEGGLGLFNIKQRAMAALLFTFLQTATNPSFRRNYFHETLYKHCVLGEPLPRPPIPPYFMGDFFPTLRDLRESEGDLSLITFRQIYEFLMKNILRTIDVEGSAPLIPLRCEQASPAAEWERTWRRVRLRGLGPDLTSFLIKLIWGVLPCKARLAKIIPNNNPGCGLCGAPETLEHALLNCPGNQGVPRKLIALVQSYSPGVRDHQVLSLDFEVDDTMELSLVWLIGSSFLCLWEQRQETRVCPHKIRAELEAKCRLLREGKGISLQNAFALAGIAISEMFSIG